ncbi:NTP transferase domain-containing protein [Desulfovibrio aerotolerans]|uniref:NTP transferase domain-containing protein n=1 Tax=Solidesulfovibrio aerotolerans TaxID=295255 RepID=A0A7C9IWU4_9BACT|nr:sugar phosphate nucleotidyltransferase [Solidesulfovibrio aerotolerans]MYL85143.1 NTP transferase domain-containing protein [Solidesulfovibrio aerotolerans]
MKAIIMAGGKGTRLAPYTAVLPKPLMPLGDVCILELILNQLKRHGVQDVILAVNHLSHIIRAFFEDGQRLGLNITYSFEDHPLGTAGPMGAALDQLSEHFFLLNGDLLSTISFSDLYREHLECRADATIATCTRELKSDFGVLDIDDAGSLVGYREKPVYSHQVSMGLYVLSREAVRPYVKPNIYLDIPDLMKQMVGDHKNVHCYECKDFWLDIGRPADYALAQDLYEKDKSIFLPNS